MNYMVVTCFSFLKKLSNCVLDCMYDFASPPAVDERSSFSASCQHLLLSPFIIIFAILIDV